MNVGICVCVLLATLSSSSLSLPLQSMRTESQALLRDFPQSSRSLNRTRQVRSAPPTGEVSNYNQHRDVPNVPNRLSQLLARIFSRTRSPYQIRSSISNRASGLAPGHRISDRDYMGWMDFGRRSAEEYEYSS